MEARPITHDSLIEDLKFGRITPERAEDIARREGLAPPIRPLPSKDDFDPMGESRWTFAMAIAWIATRNVDVVRKYWPLWARLVGDYYSVEWVKLSAGGARAKAGRGYLIWYGPYEESLLETLEFREDGATIDGVQVALPVSEAKALLINALSHGELIAEARMRPGRRDISPAEWASVKFSSQNGEELFTFGKGREEEECPGGVFLQRRDVLRLLEQQGEAKASAGPTPVDTDALLRKRLEAIAEAQGDDWHLMTAAKQKDFWRKKLPDVGGLSDTRLKAVMKGSPYLKLRRTAGSKGS